MSWWDAQEIDTGLWLGSSDASECGLEEFKTRNITHVLVAGFGLTQIHGPEHLTYHKIGSIDLPVCNIVKELPDCIAFIDGALASGGSILVHCQRGRSRSASIVCGYLMTKQHLTFVQAMWKIRQARKEVSINSGFEAQLQLYERMGCNFDGDSPAHKDYRQTWQPSRKALGKSQKT